MKSEAEHVRLNEAKWDNWAESLDGKGWRYEYLRKAEGSLLSMLRWSENVHFLDIGCGTGWALGETAKRAGNEGLFYGVDLSEKMIEQAKKNFAGRENFHFIKANVESIPLEGDFFDVIICTNSFHHYLHPDKALKEMWRLLRQGGSLYILDPTADHWIIKVADKIIGLFEREHVKMYTTNEFRTMFEQTGFCYGDSHAPGIHQKIHSGRKV